MKLFENKAISIVLMVALIAAGTWLGGWKGLSSLYSSPPRSRTARRSPLPSRKRMRSTISTMKKMTMKTRRRAVS